MKITGTFGQAAFLLIAVLGTTPALAEQASTPNNNAGCPFAISLLQADQFVQSRVVELEDLGMPLLQEMEALSAKAKQPGIAIGDQLTPTDKEQFNRLRHALIQLQVEELKCSNLQRDAHVIAGTLDVAKLADLYEVSRTDLANADPRRFYFTVLESLRLAQPKPFETTLTDNGLGCDIEAGLFFEESFNKQQLAKRTIDVQKLVDLISDIERCRTFYQLAFLRLRKEIDDARATKWTGDTPDMPDSMSPAIATSSNSAQQMWKAITPYIDGQFPSEKRFEAAYRTKINAAAQKEYPIVKKQ